MPDQVTRVTRQSWGSRIKGSIGGVVFGFLLLFGAFLLLFTNEGRAVRRYKALKQGARDVVSVAPRALDGANEGKLVHLTDLAATNETLTDPEFGVALRAIHLERSVEMYQWLESTSSETKKNLGGSTETTTTYSYRRGWSDRLVDSTRFEQPAGHANPTSMPYSSRRVSARDVTVGAFRLSDGLIQRIGGWSPLAPRSTGIVQGARLHGDGIYVGGDPSSPRVGDLRVSFRYVEPSTVTVVAKQSGGGLSSYTTRSGGTIALLRSGEATAEEMFVAARQANRVMTWILRVVGFFLMVFSLGLILGPLSVLADVVPAIGNLVGRGTGALAMGCALPLSLVTISVAWIFYRPLLALAILVPAALLAGGLLWRSRKDPAAASLPPPPPPPPVPA